ncbi:hypothetical protein D3C85_1682860 [compost metagenome]
MQRSLFQRVHHAFGLVGRLDHMHLAERPLVNGAEALAVAGEAVTVIEAAAAQADETEGFHQRFEQLR